MTLIEILISVALLAVCVTTLLYGFNLSHMMAENITYRTTAIHLVQELMEEIMGEDYDTVTNARYNGLGNKRINRYITMRRQVHVSGPKTRFGVKCKDVRVRVFWREHGRMNREELHTTITDTVSL